ncbi:MAG: helix-turn-helix transcriptional regulator [bacterium]|nr:helix-turn-helix transcriptional regulator [bacterium]
MDGTADKDRRDETAKAFARSVGAIIASLRSERGWSLEDLAYQAGRHRTYLGLVERGERHLSLASAFRIAQAFGLSCSTLIEIAEAELSGADRPVRYERRIVHENAPRREDVVSAIAGLDEKWIPAAIEATYSTLDIIDERLIKKGSPPLAEVVELANLSAIIGNLMRAALAKQSAGVYESNEPHTYPDLVSRSDESADLEIKVALETNHPKGHLPKPGPHLICRYVLANRDWSYTRGERGNVVWIWEVRLGELAEEDFGISNTAGDSGKTAVITAKALNDLPCVFFDDRFLPYAKPRAGHQWPSLLSQ